MNSSNWIEALLELAVRSIQESGTRLVRTQALSAAIHTIRAVRVVLFLHYLVQFSVFLAAFGFGAGTYALAEQFWQGEGLRFSPLLIMGWGTFAIFTGLLLFSLRERLWIQALGIEQMIENANQDSAGASDVAENARTLSDSDLEALSKMIDQAVDRKLRPSENVS